MGEQPDEQVEVRYGRLVETLANHPRVTAPGEPGSRGFGSAALKVDGSIFAMLTRGRLVVKLPQERVAVLVADGTGWPFTAGKESPMKEWLTVGVDDEETWLNLAWEALGFVASQRPQD